MIDRKNHQLRRLLAGHPFTVVCFDGDGRRFIRLFREVWRAVSLVERRRILRHWYSGPDVQMSDGRRYPTVEAGAFWNSHNKGTPLATVAVCGHSMKFKPIFGKMPDAVARALIAHELGHVVQYASGYIDEHEAESGPDGAHDVIELEADDIAEAWGFDIRILDNWRRERQKQKRPPRVPEPRAAVAWVVRPTAESVTKLRGPHL